MLQLHHVIQAETTGEKNKGSADTKESTVLPEWDILYLLQIEFMLLNRFVRHLLVGTLFSPGLYMLRNHLQNE